MIFSSFRIIIHQAAQKQDLALCFRAAGVVHHLVYGVLENIIGCLYDENADSISAISILTENIRQRLAKANLPARLKDLNLTMEQLATIAEDAGQMDIMTMLPRSMTTDELFELMKLAY